VRDLALQVRYLNGIKVCKAHAAYACSCQIQSHRRAKAAKAHNKNMALGQFGLPFSANLGERQMAAEPLFG